MGSGPSIHHQSLLPLQHEVGLALLVQSGVKAVQGGLKLFWTFSHEIAIMRGSAQAYNQAFLANEPHEFPEVIAE